MATPYVIHRLGEVGSTQEEARRLFPAAGDFPLLLVAERQSRGRGRGDSEWVSAPRAAAVSLALRPQWPPATWSRIPLVAGLAARAAIRTVAGPTPGLKWPNDIVTASGKVGGILVEASGPAVVIGCGINLWWPDPIPGAAALFDEDPGPELVDRFGGEFAERVLRRLDGDVRRWGHDEYRGACVTLGTWIRWDPDGFGEAVDVAEDGGLVVETADGRITLHSGTVRTVRPATISDVPDGEEDPR
jgi:BirA family biotin operon repressor/biotin-[acetyl-CoA-carboxylase] ligase